MTYTADFGEVSANLYPGAEAEEVGTGTGTIGRFVATGSVTQGRFGLFEWHMAAGSGRADPHYHRTFSESFYVLTGTMRFYDGDRWVEASEGDFLYVPEGGIHAFRNESGAAASMLILFAPGAPREAYFHELADISRSGRVLSDEEWTDLFARHDQYRAT